MLHSLSVLYREKHEHCGSSLMEDVFALFDSHLFIFVLFCFLFIVSLQAQERGEVLRGAADEVPLLQL